MIDFFTSAINPHSAAVLDIELKLCVFMVPVGDKLKHILWGLSLFKLEEVKEAQASRIQLDEKPAESGQMLLSALLAF